MKITNAITFWGMFLFASIFCVLPQRAIAHCDTLDGPVVTTAKAALEKGDVTPVLKWVRKEDEPEIRTAFNKTLTVRGKGPDAKELADMYFFETFVRIHRASEGISYTGLKPAGTEVNPGIAAADKSLTTGTVAPVVIMVSDDIAKTIALRFKQALELKRHKNESVVQGRKYVEAYVQYIHYVEQLVNYASGKSTEHAENSEETSKEEHH